MNETFLLIMVFVALLPANAFPVLYAFGNWRASYEGRAVMFLHVGLALMLDHSLLRRMYGDDYPGNEVLLPAVLLFVIGGLWAFFGVLVYRRWSDWQATRRARR